MKLIKLTILLVLLTQMLTVEVEQEENKQGLMMREELEKNEEVTINIEKSNWKHHIIDGYEENELKICTSFGTNNFDVRWIGRACK